MRYWIKCWNADTLWWIRSITLASIVYIRYISISMYQFNSPGKPMGMTSFRKKLCVCLVVVPHVFAYRYHFTIEYDYCFLGLIANFPCTTKWLHASLQSNGQLIMMRCTARTIKNKKFITPHIDAFPPHFTALMENCALTQRDFSQIVKLQHGSIILNNSITVNITHFAASLMFSSSVLINWTMLWAFVVHHRVN